MTVNPYELRTLGSAAVQVSRLGVGTLPLGNLHRKLSDGEAQAVLERALAVGLRYFDTAPHYGFGLAERRLGQVLATKPRSQWVLSTKVGRLLRADAPPDFGAYIDGSPMYKDVPAVNPVFDFSYEGTLVSIEESLERLGLERVDIVFIHDPDEHFRQALDGAYRALERLRSDGRIAAIGVGMNQAEMLVDFAREGDFDCFLVAGRYTLLDQEAIKDLLPLCERRHIGVVIGGAYNSGILANASANLSDLASGATYDHGSVPIDVMTRVRRLASVCDRHGVPLKAAAAQFPFGHPAVSSVLMGVRSTAELDDNLAMLAFPIPADLWAELRSEGLLPAESPAPIETAS